MSLEVKINVPEDVTRETADFLRRIVGAFAEVGDLLSDKVRYWRWQSAIKAVGMARKICLDHGVEPNAVPLKFLIPFLEKSSLEEDDSLTSRWAHLLAAAATEFDPIHSTYADILSSIDAEQASILSEMYKGAKPNSSCGIDAEIVLRADVYGPHIDAMPGVDRYGTLVIINEENWPSEEALEHLIGDPESNRLLTLAYAMERQRLVTIRTSQNLLEGEDEPTKKLAIWANLTALGAGFVAACAGDEGQ